jgi:hypothetical protein
LSRNIVFNKIKQIYKFKTGNLQESRGGPCETHRTRHSTPTNPKPSPVYLLNPPNSFPEAIVLKFY